jgi:hypothetical protein
MKVASRQKRQQDIHIVERALLTVLQVLDVEFVQIDAQLVTGKGT